MTIGFELTEHTVSENDGEVTLMVAILEGQTSIPVTIGLSTVDGTATSKYGGRAACVTNVATHNFKGQSLIPSIQEVTNYDDYVYP